MFLRLVCVHFCLIHAISNLRNDDQMMHLTGVWISVGLTMLHSPSKVCQITVICLQELHHASYLIYIYFFFYILASSLICRILLVNQALRQCKWHDQIIKKKKPSLVHSPFVIIWSRTATLPLTLAVVNVNLMRDLAEWSLLGH